MDPGLVKAVIKSNVMEKNSSVHRQGSVISLSSSAEDEEFDKSHSIRSPDGPMKGRSIKEFEEQLATLKKENFNLKLRIYFLEERMGSSFNLDKENIVKNNIELMVEIESLKKELQEKHDLLCQAVKAMELEEDEYQKNAQIKNEEVALLQQEVEELRLQIQDVKFETDNDSHKSYHSDPLFISDSVGLLDTSSRIKMFQEKITALETQLNQEKENNASLQMIIDQADAINIKCEQLQSEVCKKDETIKTLTSEIAELNEKMLKNRYQIKDLENALDKSKTEVHAFNTKLYEKNKNIQELEVNLQDIRRKYTNLKAELEHEHQRSEKNKFIYELKTSELEDELEKSKSRVQDLQKKLNNVHQDLKSNQNLLVSKSPQQRSIMTNTDIDSFSVTNAAASSGIQKKDALCNALISQPTSPYSSSQEPYNFTQIERLLESADQAYKTQILEQLSSLKDSHGHLSIKVVKLKAEQMKACAIIKTMMESRNKCYAENDALVVRIKELERELEGVVAKPSENASGALENKSSELGNVASSNSPDSEKSMELERNSELANNYETLIGELEKKIEVLVLTLKEKDTQIALIQSHLGKVSKNQDQKENKMADSQSQCSFIGDGGGLFCFEETNESANRQSLCRKLLSEKDTEIEKLNTELQKRTFDLQGLVNKELWDKNREIEKLQNKQAKALENEHTDLGKFHKNLMSLEMQLKQQEIKFCLLIDQKDTDINNLKETISDQHIQLNVLKDKINEFGTHMESGDNHLISNNNEHLQSQFGESLTGEMSSNQVVLDCENSNSTEKKFEDLQRKYEISEILRIECNKVITILCSRLEELAVFLNSLMREKSVLGLLGSMQNKKLRAVIDKSLDLSRSLNMGLFVNSEQSLTQLSDITGLLNGSDMENISTNFGNSEEDSPALSIIPDNITLTYQSHYCTKIDPSSVADDSDLQGNLQQHFSSLQKLHSATIPTGNCKEQIENNYKSFQDVYEWLPNNNNNNNTSTNKISVCYSENQSESETWSEPDINVSKARIGLFNESLKPLGKSVRNSSESPDENLCNHSRKDILNEYKHTHVKLNKQLQDVKQQLCDKENALIDLQTTYATSSVMLEEEHLKLKQHIERLESELNERNSDLITSESNKLIAENKLKAMQMIINDLQKSNTELQMNTEQTNQINQLVMEKEQLLSRSKASEMAAEKAKSELSKANEELGLLKLEISNLDQVLRKEFELCTVDKLKAAEEQFLIQLNGIRAKSDGDIRLLNETVNKLNENCLVNHLEKKEYQTKILEVGNLTKELESLKDSFKRCDEIIHHNLIDKEKLTKEINNLHSRLDEATLQYSEAVLEKTKLCNEKLSLEQELSKAVAQGVKVSEQLYQAQEDINKLKEDMQKQITPLQTSKSKLELKISELESSNAALHNKLVKQQACNSNQMYSSSLPSPCYFDNGKLSQNRAVYSRQYSDSNLSDNPLLEDICRRACTATPLLTEHYYIERRQANSSPDLGIESDQGKLSSLEIHKQTPRPLLQTLELTESLSNLLDRDTNQNQMCDNKICYEKSMDLCNENNNLKKKLSRTRKALDETVTQLSLANQRKKEVEDTICKQIQKTSQVLRKAKANLDSGSESDLHKK